MIGSDTPYTGILVEVSSAREESRASKSDKGAIMVVSAMIALSVVMSAVFASYTIGLFYGAYHRGAVDIAVMSSSKIDGSGGKAMWSVTLALRNIGGYSIEISYIDLLAGSAEIKPQLSMSPRAAPLLKVSPGERMLISLLISNHDINHRPEGYLVFIDTGLSSGMWVSVRLIEDSGNVYLISFPLP